MILNVLRLSRLKYVYRFFTCMFCRYIQPDSPLMTHLVCLQVACLFVYRHVVHDVSGSHPASVGKYLFLQKTHRREEMGLTKPRYIFKFVCFVQLFQGVVIW